MVPCAVIGTLTVYNETRKAFRDLKEGDWDSKDLRTKAKNIASCVIGSVGSLGMIDFSIDSITDLVQNI